jgi:hypothetical protein
MKAGSLRASCARTFAAIFFVAGEDTFKDTFKNTSSTLFWTLSAIVAINAAGVVTATAAVVFFSS